ncbi:hypothetical protein BKA93DRAFT_822597 [Sparassis latifolia]
MGTQPTQSLPSFAQAFSTPSLSRISSSSNALPPIQRRLSPHDSHGSPSAQDPPQPPDEPYVNNANNKKRLHAETSSPKSNDEGSDSDGRRSPRIVRIKVEADYDTFPSSSQLKTMSQTHETDSAVAPSPSYSKPPTSKRRRVTISGNLSPINTDVRTPSDNVNKSISPVVMGFTIKRDDPVALEQVRSMLTVKQQQKELIEQRRGSTASIVSTGAPPAVNVVNHLPPSDERPNPLKPIAPARTLARSPNFPPANTVDRRRSIAVISSAPPQGQGTSSSSARHPSPNTVIAPGPQLQPPPPHAPSGTHTFVYTTNPPASSHTHALPPPPISFARRRAGRQLGGAKSKPADIMISPRDPQSQPAIQSAPPVPRADQGAPGRFPPMALPRLPPPLTGTSQRQTVGRVPPTPTRLSISRSAQAPGHVAQPSGSILSRRSPLSASVPIATSLVPPTPSALHRPGYSGEKSAFLAPFETFYDALADSKQLKNWLGEQLQKSQNLTASLQRQQDQLDEMVNKAVEKKALAMREEIYGLHRRVEDLELALHVARGGHSVHSPGSTSAQGKGTLNGASSVPVAPESYTFPPVNPLAKVPEFTRRAPSPEPPERDGRSGTHSFPGSLAPSPIPFDVSKRVSVSAMRLDPRSPAAVSAEVSSSSRKLPSGSNLHSHNHSQGERSELQAPSFSIPFRYITAGERTSSRDSKAIPSSSNLHRRTSSQRVAAEAGGDERSEGSVAASHRESVRYGSPRNRGLSPLDEED